MSKSKNPWSEPRRKTKPRKEPATKPTVAISHCHFEAGIRHTPETVVAATELAKALASNSQAVIAIAEATREVAKALSFHGVNVICANIGDLPEKKP